MTQGEVKNATWVSFRVRALYGNHKWNVRILAFYCSSRRDSSAAVLSSGRTKWSRDRSSIARKEWGHFLLLSFQTDCRTHPASRPALDPIQSPDRLWIPSSLQIGSGSHPASRPAVDPTRPPDRLWIPSSLQTGCGSHPASREALDPTRPPDRLWISPGLQTGSGSHPAS